MAKISRKSKEEILESQKELKSHRSGVKIERPEGYEEYKEKLEEMSPAEREHERGLRIRENKGMSQFHTGGAGHPFQAKRYSSFEQRGSGISAYTGGDRSEGSKHLESLLSDYPAGKEHEEIIARLKGYKSAEERKDIRTRVGTDIQTDIRKKYLEQTYDPSKRYEETIEGIKYKVELAKKRAKQLATPSGLVGGLIDVLNPKITTEERIKAEREKIAKEQKIQKRRELLEKKQHELAVAAAYGGHPIRPQKSRSRPSSQAVFLSGFGNIGGFTAGSPQRPIQKIVSKGKLQVANNPFGLSESGISRPIQRPIVRQPVSVRPTERKIVRTLPRRSIEPQRQVVIRQTSNPVNDTSGNFLVNMGGMNVGSSPIKRNKTTSNDDPTGASRYF